MASSYVDRSKLVEVIQVFKDFAKKSAETKRQEDGEKKSGKKKKPKLLSIDDEEDKYLQMAGLSRDDKMLVQVSFKLPPRNKSTYINNFRPLPHPYQHLVDSTICLIVQDINRTPLGDRELDLRLSKEHYQEKLLAAGLDKDLVKQRIFILPMRELLTEYRLPEMKRKLATSYDLFLADARLLKNKFKLLPKFLGHKFWIEKKKFPIGVHLKNRGLRLRQSFERAFRTTSMYLTGNGPDTSIQFGVFKQPDEHLVDNLEFVLTKVKERYNRNVQLLRIKAPLSMAIPFYADLSIPTFHLLKTMPRTSLDKRKPLIAEHPFADAHLVVFPSGDTTIKRGWNDEDKEELEKKVMTDYRIIRKLNRRKIYPDTKAEMKSKSKKYHELKRLKRVNFAQKLATQAALRNERDE